jgi:hypothetical protein
VITTLWVAGIERPPAERRWERVCEIMHVDWFGFWRIIAEDAPRYTPGEYMGMGTCPAPMIRRSGPCGRSGSYGFRVTNPADGTWQMVGYCSRHVDFARKAEAVERAQARAGGIPEPFPNVGGLLPSYIACDWPDLYAQARPGWKPPRVGICADDWPAMAKVTEVEPPELKVLAGGVAAGDVSPVPSGESSAPSLKLIKS